MTPSVITRQHVVLLVINAYRAHLLMNKALHEEASLSSLLSSPLFCLSSPVIYSNPFLFSPPPLCSLLLLSAIFCLTPLMCVSSLLTSTPIHLLCSPLLMPMTSLLSSRPHLKLQCGVEPTTALMKEKVALIRHNICKFSFSQQSRSLKRAHTLRRCHV